MDYPAEWAGLESPSQRYELLWTLKDFLSAPDGAPLDNQALGFIFDDISADERPDGIVGGCLLNDSEDKCYRAFLRGLRDADAAGCRMTNDLRNASSSLLALMESSGVPQYEP
jgi:hypothetical protein